MPRKPCSRSTTRKNALAKEDVPQPSSTIPKPQKVDQLQQFVHHEEEGDKVQELKAQLKQAQETIAKLYEENKQLKISISNHMDICEEFMLK